MAKNFILLLLLLVNIKIFASDTLAIKSAIIKSNLFSKEKLLNATIQIDVLYEEYDSVNVKLILKSQPDLKTNIIAFVEEYSCVFSNSIFYLNGSYKIVTDNSVNKFTQLGIIKHNYMDGLTTFLIDDNLVAKTFYNMGFKNGADIHYEKKMIQSIYTFQHDTLNGSFMIFSSTGNLQECGNFENGVLQGNYMNYYENGNLKSRGKYSGHYLKRICDTCSKFKNENGKEIDVMTMYSIGFRKLMSDDMKNNYSSLGYKFNLKSGDWFYYNEQGKFIRKEHYDIQGEIKNTP
ncbi:MAG: hypothetical protein A3F72_01895 [Bacteroidetes bacterium RIFCSPLOWO2_12_FULL_35_15]|nr:MAG: hypothetical protein A3F72_01895 [Bacteroidetes bacterium RIFCSPLOWO2_12_FULL_35_15]